MGTGFAKKKKQARQIQDQLLEMQNKLASAEVTGTAGNGLVTIVLNGEHELKKLDIKPECVDPSDIDGLKLLITAAYKDASDKLKQQSMAQMPKMPPGMPDLSQFGF